jgi:hypothetical protein
MVVAGHGHTAAAATELRDHDALPGNVKREAGAFLKAAHSGAIDGRRRATTVILTEETN